MLVHDIIKIKLIAAGYLPNYPYHLISDGEMCDAFMDIKSKSGYFYQAYPLLHESLSAAYALLESAIYYHIEQFKLSKDDTCVFPDWVYSYMLGSVISVNSEPLDIHDLISPLNVDNIDDVFTPEASIACYTVSRNWLQQTQRPTTVSIPSDSIISTLGFDDDTLHAFDLRPPTMFGEPHIIKSIRLSSLSPV